MYNMLMTVTFTSLLLITGCSNNDTNTESKEVVIEESTKEEQDKKSLFEENEDLTEKLKQEEGVVDGKVYKENDQAIATIEVDDKYNEKKVSELVNKYVEEMKKVYLKEKVQVTVKKAGTIIAESDSSAQNEEKIKNSDKQASVSKITVKSLLEQGAISINPNPLTDQLSIVVDSKKLNKEWAYKKVADISLEIEGNTTEFQVNVFDETLYEVLNTDFTKAQINSAMIVIN